MKKKEADSSSHPQLFQLVQERKLRVADDIYTSGSLDSISLYHLVKDYESGHIQLPAHQRESSWPDDKKQDYVAVICQDAAPPGSLEMYSVITDGAEGPRNLNDGVQRLFAAKELLDEPAKYGLSPLDAEYVLRNTSYPIRVKKHRSHQEALERFHKVNSNVPLTPYQLTRGTILYCMGDSKWMDWAALLKRLNDIVGRAIVRITQRHMEYDGKSQMPLLHKSYRQTTSMFWRFLSHDREGSEWNVADSHIRLTDHFFEQDLALHLSSIGPIVATKRLDSFERLIEAESALIVRKWRETDWYSDGRTMRSATARWLLDVAIYRRNVDVPVAPWEAFVGALLNHNRGATEVWFQDEGVSKRISISFGRVRALFQISEIVGTPEFAEWVSRDRETPTEVLETGYHRSHVRPFSRNGNGPVVPEPGLLNLARGAKPIAGIASEDDKREPEVDDEGEPKA